MSNKLEVLETDEIKVGETGLTIRGHLTITQWKKYGQTLGALETALPWVVGDWLLYGEKEFGKEEAYAIASAIFPRYDKETMIGYKSVAKALLINKDRDPELSFSHHRVVQGLKSEDRHRWLTKAKREGWNSTVLGKAIRKAEAILKPPEEPTWERTKEVSRLLNFLKVWKSVVADDVLPALNLGKFSPEAARFYARQLRELADTLVETAKEMEKWAGQHDTATRK